MYSAFNLNFVFLLGAWRLAHTDHISACDIRHRSRMSGKSDTNSDNNSHQTRLFGEIPWNERNSDANNVNSEVVDFNNQINSLRNDPNVTNNNSNASQIIDSVAVINIETNGKSICFSFCTIPKKKIK